jgi:hypothetical protein
VRRIMNIEIIFDVPIVFSSTDIRTRGGLMWSRDQLSH